MSTNFAATCAEEHWTGMRIVPLGNSLMRPSKCTKNNPENSDTCASTKKADIPRRICLDKFCPAERAISRAMDAVELMGADVRLTDAIILLEQAQGKVADYYDECIAKTKSSTV